MSGIFKSVGKVFKKIAKVVVKIAPYALAAAAVVFTGGAALGILPTFAAAVGGVTASLGLSAGLTTMLTGAVVNAGFGAALGGIIGGKKGLTTGLLAGAASGLLGMPAIGSPGGLFGGPAATAGAVSSPTSAFSGMVNSLTDPVVAGAPRLITASAGGLVGPVAGATGAMPASVVSGIGAGVPGSATAASSGLGGLLGNPMIVGSALQGLGQGVTAQAVSKDTRRAEEERVARINGNYAVGPGLLGLGSPLEGQGDPTQGTANFDPTAAGSWVYDPRLGKMVRTPPAGVAAMGMA